MWVGDRMTVNRKIEGALEGLAGGNIWPLCCPQEEPPEEYIVYNPEDERAVDYGDDDDLAWTHWMQVHWYKRGNCNYYSIRSEIRARLKAAGFIVNEIRPVHEDGYTHLTVSCNIEED